MVKDQRKVLIVDDEETLTWSMSKSLSKDRDKYAVFIANTGKEALEVLKRNGIDLVITDIRMPDINGLDLLTAIKTNYPDTKVIIMTAYGSSDIQKEANKRGSLYYVEKPFEIADIRKLILDILWRKKGFEGKVFDLQLTDVIQLNCLCRVTAALRVDKGDQKGVIYFNDGEIVHAECDGHVGKEALFNILRWREGRFDHERGMVPPQQTISQNWEHLLVEGMRQSDEAVAPGSGSREPAFIPPPEKPPIEPATREKSHRQLVEAAVRSMARVTGCEAMMIVSDDGAILAHAAVKNIAKEGILIASLGVFSHRLSMILGAGELDRILLGWENRRLILRDRPYYFEAHLKEGARLDQVTPSLRKALSHLKGIETLPRGREE